MMKKTLLFFCCLPVLLFAQNSKIDHDNQTFETVQATGPGGVGTTDGLSDLKLWLMADAGISTNANNLVSDWTDQSGNNYNVDQNNQNKRPLYQPTGFNGQACLFFNGDGSGSQDNFLDNSSDNFTSSGGARTIFIVGRMNKCTGVGGVLLEGRRSSTVYRAMLQSNGSAINVYSDGSNSNNDASIPLTLLDTTRNSFVYTQISNGTSSNIIQRINGLNQTITQVGAISNDSGSNGFIIGLSEDNSLPWQGQIAEIIVYNSALSAQEILDVEAYLSSKYPSSTNNIAGTHTIPATEPGSGHALSFDGTDDRIVMDDELDMGTNDFSLETWIYTEPGSFVENNGVTTFGKRIISKGAVNTLVPVGEGYGLRLELVGGVKQALFFIGDDTNEVGIFADGFDDNKWYHIACIREANVIRIYVNGILKGTNSNWPNTLDVDNNQLFTLGCLATKANPGSSPTFSEHFKGKMDEVRIWNTALSEKSIRSNMCKKLTEKHAQACDLAAYYRFDNGSGTMASDLFRQTDATITGANWEVSAAPIGDYSDYDYAGALSTIALANPNSATENILALLSSGTADGIHAYYVDEAPNSTMGTIGFGNNDRYFGIHVINSNAATYDFAYEYTGNTHVTPASEPTLILLKRDNNADASWENASAILNTGTNQLIAFGESTEYALGSSGVALPVELTHLKAEVQQDRLIQLSWQTASEFNNKGFEVQRSQNGKDFQTIAWVDGTNDGNNNSFYQYDDINIEKGIRYFYRLKQLDFGDDTGALSNIVSGILGTDKFDGHVFPNPIKNQLNIHFSNSSDYTNVSLSIHDISGRTCWRQSYHELPQQLNQPIDFLATGLYLVTLTAENGQILWSSRVVK